MLGALIGLIFFCIIAGVVVWALKELFKLVPLGEPFRTLAHIAFVLITVVIIIYAAQILLGIVGIHVNTFHL